jgi:hypothetical protein
VLDKLGYDDETLFKVVKAKLDRMNNPELAAKHQQELEKNQFMQQTEFYKAQAEQALAQTTGYELESELGKSDYQAITSAYDAAYGSGAFRNLVLERGAILVDRVGRHISPRELVPMVAKEFAPFVKAPATQETAMMQSAETQQQIQKPKTIPQVGRSTASPAKQTVKSLDDLRKLRDQVNR